MVKAMAQKAVDIRELRKDDFEAVMKIDELVSASPLSALRMLGTAPLRLVVRGVRSPATGLLDPGGLWLLADRNIDWAGLHDNVSSGRFDAVALAATEIGSGRTHVFVEGRMPARALESGRMAEFTPLAASLGARHVRASAAIPILFPPVEVDGTWYLDGGVRNNTPLSPAIHLGADSLLAVNVRSRPSRSAGTGAYPGIGQMIGNLLDSVFLDRLAFDVDRLERVNDVVHAADAMGPVERERFARELSLRGRPAYREIPLAVVQPEESFGRIAVDCLGGHGCCSFIGVLSALFEDDVHTAGDAASFLLFDGAYARRLIEVGRADARRAHEALSRL